MVSIDTASVGCGLQGDGIVIIVVSKHPEQDLEPSMKVEL